MTELLGEVDLQASVGERWFEDHVLGYLTGATGVGEPCARSASTVRRIPGGCLPGDSEAQRREVGVDRETALTVQRECRDIV